MDRGERARATGSGKKYMIGRSSAAAGENPEQQPGPTKDPAQATATEKRRKKGGNFNAESALLEKRAQTLQRGTRVAKTTVSCWVKRLGQAKQKDSHAPAKSVFR